MVFSVYYITKRTEFISTHKSITDQRIRKIIPYKKLTCSRNIEIFLNIISFGLMHIIFSLFNKAYISIFLKECQSIYSANNLVVEDWDNRLYIIQPKHENFMSCNQTLSYLVPDSSYKRSKIALDKSIYIGDDFYNTNSTNFTFQFENNKYVFIDETQTFYPIHFDIVKFKNNEIHEFFKNGIKNVLEYNYLLNKYGKNYVFQINQSFVGLLFTKSIKVFNIYQLIVTIIWLIQDYWSFAIPVIVFLGTSIFFETYNMYQKTYSSKNSEQQVKVKRNLIVTNNIIDVEKKLNFINNKSQYLVPGDVIYLEDGVTLPCDIILLSGVCNVNESDITGESSLEIKVPLSCNNKEFQFVNSKSSIIYQGSKIISYEAQTNSKAVGLVINTNFNTYKSNLLQIKQLKSYFGKYFQKDLFFFVATMLLILTIEYIILYNFDSTDTDNDIEFKDRFGKSTILLTLFTWLIPPNLPICINFSNFYLNRNLSKNEIECSNSMKITTAGRVNTVIFDKTGTLTEDSLTLIGFQSTFIKPEQIDVESEKSLNTSENESSKDDGIDNVKETKDEYISSSDDTLKGIHSRKSLEPKSKYKLPID